MAHKLYDRARNAFSTTGLGALTIGDVLTGAQSIKSKMSTGDTAWFYAAKNSQWLVFIGTFTAPDQLARTTLIDGSSGVATNVDFGPGTGEIAIDVPAHVLTWLATPTLTPQGRLTLTANTPVMIATAAAQTTVRYSPYAGLLVPIYDGTQFIPTSIGAELTQATSDTTKSPAAVAADKNYDVFVWSDAGTLRATRGPAWSTDTARGTGAGTTELERVNGLLVNKIAITNGPAAQRGTYVGSIRSNASSQIDFIIGGNAAGGTAGVLGVWNAYNRKRFIARVIDTSSPWTYAAGYRSLNNSAGNRVSFLHGLQEEPARADVYIFAAIPQNVQTILGLGFNSTSSPAALGSNQNGNVQAISATLSALHSSDALGFHYFQALERSISGTTTFTAGTAFEALSLEWWG